MNKAENGFAVLSGVTVVTVTLSLPENIQRIFSQPSERTVIKHPLLKLLLIFRQSGVLLPTAEK